MGAWDYGIFDDDSACDFSTDVLECDDPETLFTHAFISAVQTSYLEQDEAHAVTVSAAYIDFILNGTAYPPAENMACFKTKFPDLVLTHLKPLAVSALARVTDENSELNELWQENEELYLQWKETILALGERLSA